MVTSNTNEFENYVKGLLECPVCSVPINLTPTNQCTNGHVVCRACANKYCILESCPICRNNSTITITNVEPSVQLNLFKILLKYLDTLKPTKHGVSKFEEYIKCLLECPVCSEPIKSTPIHQCTNGHIVCKSCIPKLENCPICRNDSSMARNLVFEQIIGNFSASELVNEAPSEILEPQKWKQGSVSVYISNKRPNVEPSVQLNLFKILLKYSDTIKSAEHGASKFEEYIKSLLECPACIAPIRSTPIHQCANGHIVCNNCISKLENCLICRYDSTIARNLVFEQIIENFSAIELANKGPPEKPELQKWRQGFVSPSFSNNGANQAPSVQLNIQPNSETTISVEQGGFEPRVRTVDSATLSIPQCKNVLCVILIFLPFLIYMFALIIKAFGL